ncbi:MAG: HlyD family efflux transporter periplasmic adaptor subunit [Candidatus Theseobacter exili]|nr:HlyD family efflux transporter periplasmic adaptor subunit [Candidatus Theseobacter exili]
MKTAFKVIILIAGAAVVLIAGSRLAIKDGEKDQPDQIHIVKKRNIRQSIRGHGTLESSIKASITSPVSGPLDSIAASLGLKVKKGDILCEISQSNIKREYSVAKAELDKSASELEELKSLPDTDKIAEAKHNLEKKESQVEELKESISNKKVLLEKGFAASREIEELENQLQSEEYEKELSEKNLNDVSQPASAEDIALSEAKYAKLKAELETLKEQMTECTVKAEIDGTIVEWRIPDASAFDGDEEIASGSVIGTIADLQKDLLVKAEVFERDIQLLKKGMEVVIYRDSSRRYPVKGTLSRISLVAETRGMIRKFPIEITINEEMGQAVRLGKTLEFDIVVREQKEVLSIPLAFLSQRNRKKGVWQKKSDGSVVFIPVNTGIHDEMYVQILSGLKENDTIVLRKGSSS